jgi:LEA14-like dessication related protein
VANSTLTEDFTVPANSSTDIDIRINVNLAAGLAIGLGVLNSQQTDIGWQLSGHVDVGIQYLGRVKIEESGTIQLAETGAISN